MACIFTSYDDNYNQVRSSSLLTPLSLIFLFQLLAPVSLALLCQSAPGSSQFLFPSWKAPASTLVQWWLHLVTPSILLHWWHWTTVFIWIVAVATINFAPSSVQPLIEGGYYSFHVRAMIDMQRAHAFRIYTYVRRVTPTRWIYCARLVFEDSYYFFAHAVRAATIRCVAIIRINTVLQSLWVWWANSRLHITLST